jgi:hypothetical protein
VPTEQNTRPEIAFPSRVGVWWNSEAWPIAEATTVARDIERMGFGSLFFGEAFGKESLTQAAAFLGATDRLVVGTGIASIHARDPIAAEVGGRTLAALHPRRFVLGLGVSHGPLVEGGRGGSYGKPLSTMRDYVRRMDEVPDELEKGGRPVRLLAALGPKMTELAGVAADGAHPAFVLPAQTVLDIYAGLPNYPRSWLRQGFTDADLLDGGSDRLARAVFGIGDAATAVTSIRAHLDAGADHVVVQVLGDTTTEDPRPALEALAAVAPFSADVVTCS